jgi:hypothetical protein
VLRLLRLAKLKKLLQKAKDNITSEKVFLALYITQLILLLVFINHFVGSIWYLVGELSQSTGSQDWITVYEIRDTSLLHKYMTSFQWSLSHFAPGTILVQPTNTGETVFAIPVLLGGMLYFALMTSSITSAIMKLQGGSEEKERQFWLLRRYLSQNLVPSSLSARLVRFLEFKANTDTDTVEEGSVVILNNLSEHLMQELKCSVHFGPLLRGHPLFAYVATSFADVACQLANSALSLRTHLGEEVLFTRSVTAKAMFYVASGRMIYNRMRKADVRIGQEDWMCEMSLWVTWLHRGECTATTECTLIATDAKEFREVIMDNIVVAQTIAEYADVYAEWLNTIKPDDLTDVSEHRSVSMKTKQLLDKVSKTMSHRGKPAKKEKERTSLWRQLS